LKIIFADNKKSVKIMIRNGILTKVTKKI